MSTLFLKDLIVYGILGYFIWYVIKTYNLLGMKKALNKAKDDIKLARKLERRKELILKFLDFAVDFAQNVGVPPNKKVLSDYSFRLMRIKKNIPYINRPLKPMELAGILKLIAFAGVFLGVTGFTFTRNAVFLIFLFTLFISPIFKLVTDLIIQEQDKEIEKYFPDLYQTLYSRLIRGPLAKLAPALDEYMRSMNILYSNKERQAIRNFIQDLRNSIEVYADDIIAIQKTREFYRSAMIINFCNLAVQALSGIDNKDKLLALRVELNGKYLRNMEENSKKLVAIAQGVILAGTIFLVAQFVILSWVAKAGGLQGIGKIFG